jgi:hypothetical protein
MDMGWRVLVAKSGGQRREEPAYGHAAANTVGHVRGRVGVIGNHDLGAWDIGERGPRSLGVAWADDDRVAPRPQPRFPHRTSLVVDVEFVEQADCRNRRFELF